MGDQHTALLPSAVVQPQATPPRCELTDLMWEEEELRRGEPNGSHPSSCAPAVLQCTAITRARQVL